MLLPLVVLLYPQCNSYADVKFEGFNKKCGGGQMMFDLIVTTSTVMQKRSTTFPKNVDPFTKLVCMSSGSF